MTIQKMHEGEVDIDATLVQRLLATQLPRLAHFPIAAVRSSGTVNAIFRLGDHLCVRLPRAHRWAGDLTKELVWLPKLRPHLSLTVPEPVAEGQPGCGYPFPWAVYRWISGETFTTDNVHDERRAATDLATFIAELRRIDPSHAPRSGRPPLRQLDGLTRAAIESLNGVIDTELITAVWDSCLHAPEWDGAPAWRHCDLLPTNLLFKDGRLVAILDFGGAGIGDPAIDIVPAWSVFGSSGRDLFRGALNVDYGTWARARGFALHQALLIIPYYAETHPGFVTTAKRTVSHVIDDADL